MAGVLALVVVAAAAAAGVPGPALCTVASTAGGALPPAAAAGARLPALFSAATSRDADASPCTPPPSGCSALPPPPPLSPRALLMLGQSEPDAELELDCSGASLLSPMPLSGASTSLGPKGLLAPSPEPRAGSAVEERPFTLLSGLSPPEVERGCGRASEWCTQGGAQQENAGPHSGPSGR